MCNRDEITIAHSSSGPQADSCAFGFAGAEEAFVLLLAALLIAFRADEQVLHTVFECSVITSQTTARYDTDTSKLDSLTGVASYYQV